MSEMKLRICRVTDSFPPPWTGISPGIYELSDEQARRGIEVHVITKYRKGCGVADSHATFCVHRVRGRSMLFEMVAVLKIIMLHRKHKFNLIHSHGSSLFFLHLLRELLPRLGILGIPLAVSVHNIRAYQDSVYEKSDFFSLAENVLKERLIELRKRKYKMLRRHGWEKVRQRISYSNADLVLPVSRNLGRVLETEYGIKGKKIAVIYNGVSRRFITTNCKGPSLGKFTGHKILLFVGRTIGTKNEVSLICALAKIRKVFTKVMLVIIGDGYWHDVLRRLANNLSLEDNIMLFKHVEHDVIKDYYNCADIFVFPSFSEGLPKVVLEAMACGVPVVASDVDGNNELIQHGETGMVIRPNDPKDLAEKVCDLLKDSRKAKALGQAGKQFVVKEFTWDRVAERCRAAYDGLLEGRGL